MHRLTRCRAHAHPVSMAITRRRTITDRFIIIINVHSPYEWTCRRAERDGSDYIVPGNSVVTVVCGRRLRRLMIERPRRRRYRDDATATGQQLCYRTDDEAEEAAARSDFISYYIKIIGPCWHKRCVQAAEYFGGRPWTVSLPSSWFRGRTIETLDRKFCALRIALPPSPSRPPSYHVVVVYAARPHWAQHTLLGGSAGGHRFRAQRLPSPHEPISSDHPTTVRLSGCYCAWTKSWITINIPIAYSHRKRHFIQIHTVIAPYRLHRHQKTIYFTLLR